jgi:hypothetical protein
MKRECSRESYIGKAQERREREYVAESRDLKSGRSGGDVIQEAC